MEDFIMIDTVVAPPEGDGDSSDTACTPVYDHHAPAGMRSLFTEGVVYLPNTYQANSYFLQHGAPPPQSQHYVRGPHKRCGCTRGRLFSFVYA